MLDMPYFIENEEWYEINPDMKGPVYVLTDKAPSKAIASYKEFYEGLKEIEEA